MGDILKYKHFIDGVWTSGESGELMDVINPANQEVVARVPKGTTSDVDKAVASARKAFESGIWSEKTVEERALVLHRAAGACMANKEKLSHLESLTAGATIRRTTNADVAMLFMALSGAAAAAIKLPKVEYATMLPLPVHSYWKREPIGVCAGITPWNFPLILAILKVAPALAMGNSIVVKPASITPVTTLELAKILYDAGVPAGVFNVVTGPGSSVGNYLASHPQIDKIAFTGSTEVGRQISHLAADGIKRVTLELGGKSPLMILDDADMDIAAKMSMLAFMTHQGQVCVSGTRLFVPRRMQDELIAKMSAKMKQIVIGNQMDPASDMGPLVSKNQLDIVKKYVEIGKQAGADLVYGGKELVNGELGKGFFHQPTLFANCNNQMRQAREEIFGPVQCIIPYDDVDEAIAMANDTDYGLAAGICSTNTTRAQQIASKIRAGNVYINTYHLIRPDAPFGGFKQSGIGREGSYIALHEYSEIKLVHQNLTPVVDLFGMMGL
jgi:aldehyde dehydrogenase (NAD+)